MSSLDVVIDYSKYSFIGFIKSIQASVRNAFLINYIFNLSVIATFGVYFFNSLNMAEKIFTFAISGKVIGSSYILTLRDVYIISGIIVGVLFAHAIVKLINTEKNRNKIKLRFEASRPLYLEVKLA
jgi:hypothetical protein